MRVMKFEGATMRDAIAKVKAELGDQAVIISTRQVRRGLLGTAVEISAAIDHDDAEPPPSFAGPSIGGPLPPAPVPAVRNEDVEKLIAPLRSELRSLRALVRASGESRGSTEIRTELLALRRLVEELHKPAPAAPVRAPAPAAPVRAPAPAAAVRAPAQPEAPRARRATAAHELPLTAPSAGHIVMLVGPTGAGKTTTVAKLAARAALLLGHTVGIITLDDYRVGGEEQLRIYADLIPAEVHVASNRMELARALHALAECDLIYVDTSGRSPRDHQAHAELAGTLSAIEDLEVHLVVPAPSAPAYIDGLAARYQTSLSIDRLLFTKVDEADDLSQLVRAPARLGLRVAHITDGQAVPEDLEDVDDAALLRHATLRPAGTRAA
jgi:flagellar biosynthesis protein FlhF